MAKCSFCGRAIEKGTGKMVIRNTGKISYFCSSKCEKNAGMRDPRRVKWAVKTQNAAAQ